MIARRDLPNTANIFSSWLDASRARRASVSSASCAQMSRSDTTDALFERSEQPGLLGQLHDIGASDGARPLPILQPLQHAVEVDGEPGLAIS